MPEYSGFLIRFDEPQRAYLLQEYAEINRGFSENLSAPDWSTKSVEVCFLCFDGEGIDYAALATRRGRSATQKYRVEFSDFVKFEPTVPSGEIRQVIGERYNQYLIRSTSGIGGRVPIGTWKRLIAAISQLRPDTVNELNGLFDLRLEKTQFQTGLGFEIMAQEKDATGLALEFSELDRRAILTKRYQKADVPAPFLNRLHYMDVLEDSMVFHDMEVFADWQRSAGAPVGMAVFEDGQKRLTIINANRTPLEMTLGVDLIYYHDQFNSYIMVQYKRMEKEGEDWVYRPDEQLDREIDRMRAFQVANPDAYIPFKIFDYRLHPGLFYLKLCPERVFAPYSSELIKGMYLPIDYFDVLRGSREMRGRSEGLRVSWDKTSRYMNNTLFTDLVKDGWIGARTVTSDTLTEIIRDSLEGNRSLLLARRTSYQR